MASVEIANLKTYSDIFTPQHLNVSGIVGLREENERNDVMLIKALLFLNEQNKDVSDAKYWGSSRIDLIDLPEINGILDIETMQAIWGFQRRNASSLLSTDGKIHPASYKNRLIKNSFGAKLMSITLLNKQAYHAPIYLGVDNLEQAVRKIAPTIRFT